MIEQKTIYAGVGLIFVIIIAAIIGAFVTNLPKYYRLSKYGIKSQGTVTSKEEKNHQSIKVEYEVSNQKFKTGGLAENFGRNFFSVSLNEKVPVYYNPDFPEESCLGDPEELLKTSIVGTCFISTFPIIFLLGYLIKTRPNKDPRVGG